MDYRQFGEPEVQTQFQDQTNNDTNSADGKLVRLRALESEAEFFLKSMNVTTLRWLAWIQMGASGVVFVSQILLYGIVGRGNYYKPVDYIGIGIWGPLLFFVVASGLTWMATKYPSGCNIGTAMGFQITTVLVGVTLIFLSVISLIMHGRYNYSYENYDPESAGRVFCSFMILSAAVVTITAVFASVHFCRSVCCGRQRVMEGMMFDVVTVK